MMDVYLIINIENNLVTFSSLFFILTWIEKWSHQFIARIKHCPVM